MKKIIYILSIVMLVSCNTSDTKLADTKEETPESNRFENLEDLTLSQEFKDYWYAGKAEISSYALSQSRYGELRDGKAVLIFVTEPYDTIDEVKADQPDEDSRPVMKLNATRDFNTGIYPYSIMSSTFLPLDKKDNALKISSSIQEWCGHTYMQFNQNDEEYDIELFSYFQSEVDYEMDVENVMTENQIPIQLRLNPMEMPTGAMKVIPSAEYLRLKHIETKAYDATASLREIEDGLLYSIRFTELNRMIAFKVQKEFPHKILAWMDRYTDGGQPMVSTGTLIETMNTPYWNQNSNEDEVLRNELGI